MRIGIDAHNLEGERTGVGRYLLNILRYWPTIAPKNTEVFLYFKKEVPGLQIFANGKPANNANAQNLFIPRLLKPFLGKQSMAAFTHILLPRAATSDKVDMLWCPAYIAPLFWKKGLALTLHDIIFAARPDLYDWPSWADRFLMGSVARQMAKRADVIFVPSMFTKQEIIRLWRIPEARITVTPLAPDPAFSEFGAKPEVDIMEAIRSVKAQYGLAGKRYFFFYGTLFKRRKPLEIIEAFKMVAQDFPDIELFLAGSPTKYSRGFIGEIAATHLKPDVHVAKWKAYVPSDHIPALIRGARAVLYISEYEGFGLPVLEAMATGAPVITSRTASLPEVAGDCALYIENPSNVKEIASAMRRMLLDEDLMHDKSQCGFLRAKQFSWAKCSGQTLRGLLSHGSDPNTRITPEYTE